MTELGVVFNRATLSDPKDAAEISANQDHVGSILAVTDDKGRRVNDPDSFPSRGQFVIV